jgi:hypothetical protein
MARKNKTLRGDAELHGTSLPQAIKTPRGPFLFLLLDDDNTNRSTTKHHQSQHMSRLPTLWQGRAHTFGNYARTSDINVGRATFIGTREHGMGSSAAVRG